MSREAVPIEGRQRRTRVSLIAPNGAVIGHFVTEPIFNANAQTPLRVTVEAECPCCGNWAKVTDEFVGLWG